MDDMLKLQIENIADMCNCSNKKIVTPQKTIIGVMANVSLQFHQLESWRAILEFDGKRIYFAKWDGCKLITYLAMSEELSPACAVNTLFECGKSLIDRGFICIKTSDANDL